MRPHANLMRALLAFVMLIPLLGAAPGGFRDVAVDDPGVKVAADFAIKERAKNEPNLKLDKIAAASKQVVAGTNYRLTLQVTVGKETKTATVIVWAKLDGSYEMTSWEYAGK